VVGGSHRYEVVASCSIRRRYSLEVKLGTAPFYSLRIPVALENTRR